MKVLSAVLEGGGVLLQPRLNIVWVSLISLALFFSVLYLYSTFFPGGIVKEAWQYFKSDHIDLARSYVQVPRLLFILSFIVQTGFLIWFVFSGRVVKLSRLLENLAGKNSVLAIVLFFACTWLILRALDLPFSLYSGYYWQHDWGFSTQSITSWWEDYLRGALLDLLLSGLGVILLFRIMSIWPRLWWVAAAGLFSIWLIVQSFVWPVIVSPLFNKFTPATDHSIISMVDLLSKRADIQVDQILLMDASRRTTKANAYFTGLGNTKRIVLYDNLVKNYPSDEVEAVIAHEMAHWRQGHIIKGLTLGILGNFIIWGLLYLILRSSFPMGVKYQPHVWAVVLLFLTLTMFVSSPIQNYFSREMEKEADRVAVRLTENVPASVRLQVDLAKKNLSDVSPPSFIEWFSYTHPSAITRIKLMENELYNRVK